MEYYLNELSAAFEATKEITYSVLDEIKTDLLLIADALKEMNYVQAEFILDKTINKLD